MRQKMTNGIAMTGKQKAGKEFHKQVVQIRNYSETKYFFFTLLNQRS